MTELWVPFVFMAALVKPIRSRSEYLFCGSVFAFLCELEAVQILRGQESTLFVWLPFPKRIKSRRSFQFLTIFREMRKFIFSLLSFCLAARPWSPDAEFPATEINNERNSSTLLAADFDLIADEDQNEVVFLKTNDDQQSFTKNVYGEIKNEICK